MVKGSIYPLGDNFSRWHKPNIVSRMRKWIDSGVFQRPAWMTAVERAPPLELQSLHLNKTVMRNPYPALVNKVLKKYPNLRFQDCFVDGNDWAKGLDRYRDDHPAMQFASHQLDLLNRGFSKQSSFKITEKLFYERRMRLEKEQKLHMALGLAKNVRPLFTSGQAYWQSELANKQLQQYQKIREHIRRLRILHELKTLRTQVKKGKVSPSHAMTQATGPKILTEEQILRIQSFTDTYMKLGPRENAKAGELLSSILTEDPGSVFAIHELSDNGDNLHLIKVEDAEVDMLLKRIRALIIEDDFGSALPATGSLLDDETANNLRKWSELTSEGLSNGVASQPPLSKELPRLRHHTSVGCYPQHPPHIDPPPSSCRNRGDDGRSI